MNVNHYNIFSQRLFSLLSVIALLFGVVFSLSAQQLPSKTLNYNYEKFKQYQSTDQARAYEYAELVVQDMDSLAVNENAAIVYSFMADYCEGNLYRYRDALDYRSRAYRIYETLGNRAAMTKTGALLARVYVRNSDYHNAFSSGVRALNDARELGDSTTVREAYLTLEQIDFFYHQDKEQAMAYNRRVAECYTDSIQAYQSVRALNNRFNYDLSPTEVNDLISRTEAICSEYGFNDQLVNVYLNAAMQEFTFGDYDASLSYLKRVKPLIANFKEEGYYYSAMGFYHLNMGNISRAISDLKLSIELLGNGDFDSKNVHSYFLLQDIYYNQGRYREAYEALMAFAEIYTRQHNNQNIIELSLLINDMELNHARQEHIRREEIHRREREHSKMVTKLYTLSVVVILIVGVLVYSRYRLERMNRDLQRAKAEQELSYKNEIIKIQKLQQFQEQTYIDKLTQELSAAINMGDNREMRVELRRIIRQLHSDAGSSSHWAEVEKTLAGGNDIFYENLLKEHPSLTKNERKLCLFIHMNMSTKEISSITRQSPGSINVARSRLRQKFGLTGDDKSLIAYLDQFGSSEK